MRRLISDRATAKFRVQYNHNESRWLVTTDHVTPTGIHAAGDTKKEAVRKAKDTAKRSWVRPSEIVIEQKNWSSVDDQRTVTYE